jgi:mono/diheme cytochrome c family protein
VRITLFPLSFVAFLLACAGTATAADAERGRTLYSARCDGCHAESVHSRQKRAAAEFDAIRGWVRRWSLNLGLKWSEEEIDDVSAWLNARYYRFPCPPATCTTTGHDSAKSPALAAR